MAPSMKEGVLVSKYMNSRDIAFLSCRFFAIFILLQTLYAFAVITPSIFGVVNAEVSAIAIVVAIFIVLFGCASLFWLKAGWISSKIVGSHSDQPANISVDHEKLQNVGFAVIGMFVLAGVLPRMANSIVIAFLEIEERVGTHKLMAYNIQLGLEFIIGVSLLLGADGISHSVNKLRGKQ